jgi:hypothetical protein
MFEAPYDNGGLPLGVRSESTGLTFDCMVCHSGRVAGQTVLGAPNPAVDLESLFDDLASLRSLAVTLGITVPALPYNLDGFTYSSGAQDAFGLGFRIVGAGAAGLNTQFGPQHAPAWWLLHYKQHAFVDGAGDASGHRTMAATLVAFGLTPDQISARDADFVAIANYIRSLESPCWTLTTLDSQKEARGQQIFNDQCASCHGVQTGPNAQYPDNVVAFGDVGTDPTRAQRFGQPEATALNASWFGVPPLKSTGGYLAQPLAGVWAHPPYFHNGSVPDLAGVLDPTQRPKIWKRTGSERADYDVDRMGLRYQTVSTAPDPTTREGRLVYDTTRQGMGNGGHLYGASLTDAERSDLLEYLRGL